MVRVKVWLFFVVFLFLALPLCACGGDLMRLSSPEFAHNASIPARFTCQGDDINPSLEISAVPPGTKSLVLIMDDPDAPGHTWDHWIVYDIPPATLLIEENSVPGVQGTNSWGRQDYGGPCPPSGTHRYVFTLYALDSMLDGFEGRSKNEVLQAMQGHILDTAELIGLYRKR
jgi:hypothetical protein